MAISPCDKVAASGDANAVLRLWCVETGECISVIKVSDGGYEDSDDEGILWPFKAETVAFSQDGSHVAVATSDGIVTEWSTQGYSNKPAQWDDDVDDPTKSYQRYSQHAPGLLFYTATQLICGAVDGVYEVWDKHSSESDYVIVPGYERDIPAVWGVSKDMSVVVLGSPCWQGESSNRIWHCILEVCKGSDSWMRSAPTLELAGIVGGPGHIMSMAVSPKGDIAVTSAKNEGTDGDLILSVWDVTTGAHRGSVMSIGLGLSSIGRDPALVKARCKSPIAFVDGHTFMCGMHNVVGVWQLYK